MTYTWEKFHLAMRTLAGEGTVQYRLAEAFAIHLLHIDVSELPDEIQPLYRELRERMTRDTPTGDENRVQATVSSFSDDEALACVEQLMVMIDAVARREGSF